MSLYISIQLPEILKILICLKLDDEMPCFDPKDVIFITNKWDIIEEDDSDSEEEDQKTKTWKKTLSDIKSHWLEVDERNIFRLNLKEVQDMCLFFFNESFKQYQFIALYLYPTLSFAFQNPLLSAFSF